MLNELDNKLTSILPKTDSRLRPDIRKMEIGDIGKSVDHFVHIQPFELIPISFLIFLYLVCMQNILATY